MSHPLMSNKNACQKERKTRRAHTKVKTGCTTCKIRRKKCDETKPECLRCTSTGRKCDGYTSSLHEAATTTSVSSLTFFSGGFYLSQGCSKDVNSSLSKRPKSKKSLADTILATPPLSLCRAPSTVTFSSDIDYHCFDYFRFNTGPQFESYFDSSIWKSTAIRIALLHPVVLKAATAVGAVHRRHNYGISREAFEYCAIADRLYREAAQDFMCLYQSRDIEPSSREIIMVCSMLFLQFESFQGNYDKAVQHMSFGLKNLWAKPLLSVQSESRYLNYEMEPSILQEFFDKLYLRVTQLFDSPPRILALANSGEPLPPIPPCFKDLKEAGNIMFTDFEWIIYTPTWLWQDPIKRRERQNLHVTRLLQWSAAYAEMVRSGPERTPEQKEACLLLKLLRDASHLLLYLVYFVQADNEPGLNPFTHEDPIIDLDFLLATDEDHISATITTPPPPSLPTTPPPESSTPILTSSTLWTSISTRRDLSTKISRLSLHIDTILDPTNPYNYTDPHSLRVETGIGPPRFPQTSSSSYYYCCPEGSSKTQHLIKALLQSPLPSSPSSIDTEEGKDTNDLWSSLGIYSVAERLSSIEEFAVLDAVASLTSVLASTKGKMVEWIDVTCFLEGRKVLLKYCWDDGLGERGKGLVWTQEWLEF